MRTEVKVKVKAEEEGKAEVEVMTEDRGRKTDDGTRKTENERQGLRTR